MSMHLPPRMRPTAPLQRAALAALALAALALAGCSSGLRSDAAAPVTYVLRAPAAAAPPAAASASPATLQVLRVVAHPGYESDRIVLLAADRRLDVYAASRWAATAPEVVGALAVDALRAAGNLRAVHDDTAPFAADYALRIAIRRFDADYSADGMQAAPQVRVVLDCTIARRADRAVVATFVAEASGAAASNRMAAVVAGFDESLQAALAALVARSAEAIAEDLRTSTAPSPP